MPRKTALVICPGRGAYNREELGYLGRYHGDKSELLARIDAHRTAAGQETISALDGAASFSVSHFTRGDNASSLIYTCAYLDFHSIDTDAYDIVAVTGNSMGWYIALACAGALDIDGGFEFVNTMGTLMHDALIGGQLLYPFVDENWEEIPGKRAELIALTERIPNLHVSIYLGGMVVFAGDAAALETAGNALEPVQERFPMRLVNHAAFHTQLQEPVALEGQARLPVDLLRQPDIPLIDGRGHTWLARGSNLDALWNYTLGHQVVAPYDFTSAVRNGLREFAPDAIIILGPGQALGGAVAQCLINERWHDISNKRDFLEQQAIDPFVYAMGIEEQRARVVRNGYQAMIEGRAKL